ncbi:hypothetical protein TSAR_005408 [Trichomalopsis sarcophagae]|uniref:Uncharacterized protein n=1 Tax=Trichomalopsis sarcophagae TaxID=543379 RepID=A0A232ER32_9HYME|nr:hypothetical protein TSAR_005408 [Trichomalopsis sarcophagae]
MSSSDKSENTTINENSHVNHTRVTEKIDLDDSLLNNYLEDKEKYDKLQENQIIPSSKFENQVRQSYKIIDKSLAKHNIDNPYPLPQSLIASVNRVKERSRNAFNTYKFQNEDDAIENLTIFIANSSTKFINKPIIRKDIVIKLPRLNIGQTTVAETKLSGTDTTVVQITKGSANTLENAENGLKESNCANFETLKTVKKYYPPENRFFIGNEDLDKVIRETVEELRNLENQFTNKFKKGLSLIVKKEVLEEYLENPHNVEALSAKIKRGIGFPSIYKLIKQRLSRVQGNFHTETTPTKPADSTNTGEFFSRTGHLVDIESDDDSNEMASQIKGIALKDAIDFIPRFNGANTPLTLFTDGCMRAKAMLPETAHSARLIHMRLFGDALMCAGGHTFTSMEEIVEFFEKNFESSKTYPDVTGELAKAKQGLLWEIQARISTPKTLEKARETAIKIERDFAYTGEPEEETKRNDSRSRIKEFRRVNVIETEPELKYNLCNEVGHAALICLKFCLQIQNQATTTR